MKKSGFWYIFSYGLSMLYPLMLTVVGETPYLSMRKWIAWLALWQVMAAVLSIVALLKYKKKEDRMLSVMSLIFAVVEGAFMSFVVILLQLVPGDVADGSLLFCNTVYPEKSK